MDDRPIQQKKLELKPCSSIGKGWNILINIAENKVKQKKVKPPPLYTQKSILVQLNLNGKGKNIKRVGDNF